MRSEEASDVRSVLTDEIVDSYLALLQEMHSTGTPAICQMDVTMSQVKTLLTVSMKGEATVGYVAQITGVGQPAASTAVDRLVNLGWLDRTEDPVDRRRAIVSLTPSGHEVVETVWRVRRDLLQAWLERMEEKDLTVLARGLAALRSAAESENEIEVVPAV